MAIKCLEFTALIDTRKKQIMSKDDVPDFLLVIKPTFL